MKYLIAFVVVIYFIVIALVGCNPYRSKSKLASQEQRLVDYNYGDFEDVMDNKDYNDVYHVKYVHIIL